MENYQKYHSTLANEDLVRIAFFERGKMKKEARNSARSLLQQRQISSDEIKSLKDEIRTRKRKESEIKLREKGNEYGIWDFLVDLVIFS